MSSIFIFGAGASYGSGSCFPGQPPLGRDLLTAMRKAGGIASTIEGDLLKEFNDDPEKGMVRFFQERNEDTAQLLREMAAFLAKYEIGDDNNYLKLISKLKDKKNIYLASTNYDLLIEQAIGKAGKKIQYQGGKIEKNNIPLLKIHGSSNFIPDIDVTGISFPGNEHRTGSIIDCDIRVLTNIKAVLDYCNSDTALAPAIAMYHPDKTVLFSGRFVKEQQQHFKTETLRAKKIFIIGLKLHLSDLHIWSVLEKAKGDIYIVDRDDKAHLTWMKDTKKNNVYHIADSFESSLIRIYKLLGINK